jgi:hypothetical protein
MKNEYVVFCVFLCRDRCRHEVTFLCQSPWKENNVTCFRFCGFIEVTEAVDSTKWTDL